MTQGVELATVWIRLTTSAEGVTDDIVKAFAPGEKIASEQGAKAGQGWSKGAKSAVAAGAVAAGIAASFVGLYKVGEIFDDVTDTIRVGTGAQGEVLEGLVDVAKNVGREVPAEFSAIGATVSDLNTRLGLSGDTLQTVASQYLEAGRILGEDVDISTTTGAFSAFRIEGEGVIDAMDTLFQVSQATGVGINELASGAQAVAPAMQTLGFSFEDTVAMVGSFDKAGLNSTAIMASMSKGMVNLAKDGEQPADAYQRVVGELQGFVDTGDKAAALNLASEVFGTKGAAQFVGALESGVLNMGDLMAATGATGDTILGVGAETMDFAERWKTTMNSAMLAIEPLASAVFTSIGDGLNAVMPGLQALGEWMEANPVVIQIIAAGLLILALAFIGVTVATWALNTALLANPITWIIIGIVALIAAIVLLIMNWDAVVKFLSDTWAGFVGWITIVMEGFAGWWNGVWAGLGGFITDVWNGFIGWITDNFNLFLLGIQIIGAAISTWWTGLWGGFAGFVQGVWAGLVGFVTDSFNNLFYGLTIVGAAISGWWNGLWAGFAGFVQDAFSNVANFVIGILNTVIDLVNGALSGINDMGALASQLTGGAVSWSVGLLPGIPGLARGGSVMDAGSVLVGEEGPEILHLPAGAQVQPLDYTRAGSDSGDQGDIVLQLDGREFMRWIRRQFRRFGSTTTPVG